MMIHLLKIEINYFIDIVVRKKKFEIRKNDRDYKVGDLLFLNEYDDGEYTGNMLFAKITYLQTEYVKKGYVALGIEVLDEETLKAQKTSKINLITVFVNNTSFVECATFDKKYAQKISDKILDDYSKTNNLVSVRNERINFI